MGKEKTFPLRDRLYAVGEWDELVVIAGRSSIPAHCSYGRYAARRRAA